MNQKPPQVASMTEIGVLIRNRRHAQGLTQRDLADVCGFGFRFISELERGKESVEAGRVLRVLKELGLRITIE